MADETDRPHGRPESSYVLAAREYADVAHLENPNVIERVFSRSRSEAVEYVGALLQSGVSRYALAGPKVALTAMTIEALRDLWGEIAAWRAVGRIPEDFSGRRWGYQSWVELLQEIDSNPVDADRLKALKAMFLASNRPNASDGEQILGYQLFQIAKRLSAGDLLVLKTAFKNSDGPTHDSAQNWLIKIASAIGHNATALIALHERVLVDCALISPRHDQNLQVRLENGPLTDLGLAFCRNLENYPAASDD
jgi:hypothetical protein